MGQQIAGYKPWLYAGLQRSSRPFRQRIIPLPCQDRRRNHEDADRKDPFWSEVKWQELENTS